MKQRIQGIIMGSVLAAVMVFGATAIANTPLVERRIPVAYSDYKVVMDGQQFTAFNPIDNSVMELFNYDGWIYAPFENIAASLGKETTWIGSTRTLYLGGFKSHNPFAELTPATATHAAMGRVESAKSVKMGGDAYYDAIRYFSTINATTHSTHNLNGQYRQLSGYIGRIDNTRTMNDATFIFYGDGRMLATHILTAHDLPKHITVNVANVRQLRIEVIHSGASMYAFAAGNIE
jgi:hypothetical protein